MPPRITNLVLAEKIGNLKESIEKRNGIEDRRITILEAETKKNTVAIAGIKGASGVIAFVVSAVMSGIGLYFGTKH